MMSHPDKEIRGIVLNIQRFSVHDGPGIRTNVFLKGCTLKCKWCSNPESQSYTPELAINWNICVRCMKCISDCLNRANYIKDGRIVYSKKKCKLCGLCLEMCPAGARKLYGKSMSSTDVIEEVKKDKHFYSNSEGGITISGGEPFLQSKFLLVLLKASQEELIHTAIETSGYFRWQKITEEILKFTDLVLFDLKLMDEEKHKKFTGKGNKLILENLEKIAEKVKTIIRIPVIHGINDDDVNVNEIIKLIRDLKKIEEVNLLPYHRYGEFKYEMLQRKYNKDKFVSPDSKRLEEIKSIFELTRIKVKIEE